MARILAIDDNKDILQLIQSALTRDGHMVYTQVHTKELTPEQCHKYELILLDIMMPEEDGFSFCRRIREYVNCPILFLTAKTEDTALVHGLGLGADDYIRKPFTLTELRARVNAHLRREHRLPVHAILRNGIRFDLMAKEAYMEEERIPFTKSEYSICEYLSENVGQVFSKEQLYEAVFGYGGTGDASAIAEHIKNIRAKLKNFGLVPIETVWGVGYKWIKESAQ